MKADLLDPCDTFEASTDGVVAAGAARVRDVLQRFPAISQGILSLFDQAIVSGASFVTAMIIGRTTSQETMGLYYLIVGVIVVAVGVQENMIATPYLIYSKRRSGADLVSYTGSVWFHHLALTLAGMMVLFGIIAAMAFGSTGSLAPQLWVLLAAAPLMLLREWIRRFAFANLEIKPALVVDAVVAVLQLGGLVWLAMSGSLTVLGIFGVMGGACFVATLGWYLFARPQMAFEPDRFWDDWKCNWNFGKWTIRSYLVGNTTQYIMPWILNAAVSTAAAGVLGACITLINLANLFMSSIDRVLTPRAAAAFARGGARDLMRVLAWTALAMLPAVALFCVVVFAAGSQVAVLVYGEQYAGTGMILSVLSLTLLANGVGTLAGNGLWAIDQPRANFLADVCCLVVTLGSAMLLVNWLDTLGAALALLAGALLAAVVRSITFWFALSAFRHPVELSSSTSELSDRDCK